MNVETEEQNVEVYENDIEMYLQMYCERYHVKDEYDMFPSQWNAALKFICNHVFKTNPHILKIPHTVSDGYNLHAVNELLEMYIFMCYSHSQEISITGFCFLSGISRETIHSWGGSRTRSYVYKDKNGNVIDYTAISNLKEGEYIKEASSTASDVYKKLVEQNEESLVCLLKDRRYNPLKYLSILNRRHNWNMPGVRNERSDSPQLTSDNLPKLCENGSQLAIEKGE